VKGRQLKDGSFQPKVLELRHAEEMSDIWARINFLRWDTGAKARPITAVKQTKIPSIQGEWNPFVKIE
jgi:hypothetical protein